MKALLFLVFAFACFQGYAGCRVGVGESFNMPEGKITVPADALAALKAKGYTPKLVKNRAHAMTHSRYFIEVFASCSSSRFNIFMKTCTAHAVMTDFENFRDIGSGSSPEQTHFGEYVADIAGALNKLPDCRDLRRQ